MTPDAPLQVLKRYHYRRLVSQVTDVQEPDFNVVRKIVRRGARVADIGANIGVYTRLLSELVGEEGVVHCVEPIPPTFDILAHNTRSLGLKNVLLHNVAISDRDGDVMMEVPTFVGGGEDYYEARIVSPEKASRSLRHFTVPTESLDAFVNRVGGKIGFLKIDVEGHELNVIRGGSHVLANVRPTLLIEVTGDIMTRGEAANEVRRFILDHEYQMFWFDGVQLQPGASGKKVTNYLCVPDAENKR